MSISDKTSDRSRVACPVCGADFGTWGDIRAAMVSRLGQPFHDRESWRTVEQ